MENPQNILKSHRRLAFPSAPLAELQGLPQSVALTQTPEKEC